MFDRLKIINEFDAQIRWLLFMNTVSNIDDFIVPHDMEVEEEAIKAYTRVSMNI